MDPGKPSSVPLPNFCANFQKVRDTRSSLLYYYHHSRFYFKIDRINRRFESPVLRLNMLSCTHFRQPLSHIQLKYLGITTITSSACSHWLVEPKIGELVCLCLPSRFKLVFAEESGSNLTMLSLSSLKAGQEKGKPKRQHDHPPCWFIAHLLSFVALPRRVQEKIRLRVYSLWRAFARRCVCDGKKPNIPGIELQIRQTTARLRPAMKFPACIIVVAWGGSTQTLRCAMCPLMWGTWALESSEWLI